MTTCRDIVTRALQMSGVVRLGRDPKATEAEAGMISLQSLYDEWVNGGMFGRLTDVFTDVDYTAAEGDRVTVDGAIVTLPDTVDDGTTRAPYKFSCVVLIENGEATNYVYYNGAWRTVSGLTLNDDAPLATISVDGLAGALASRICSTFGGDVSVGSQRAALQFMAALSLKIGSTQPVATAVYY